MENRFAIRFLYNRPVDYMVMGDAAHPPIAPSVPAEIMDVSSSGMKVRVKGWQLSKGVVLRLRVPLSDIRITLPVLAQVRWSKKEEDGEYQAGLRFIE